MIKSLCLLHKLKNETTSILETEKINGYNKFNFFSNRKSFMMGIIGKPGSGKTSVIQELLLNPDLLCGYFEIIIIFSPSKFDFIECIENENWFSNFSIEILEEIIEMIQNLIKDEIKKEIKILLIFDDLISSFKSWKTSPKLMSFFFNRRHLLPYNSEISIILTTQRYAVIPINFRACLNDLIIFRLNDRDYRFIKEDSVGNLSIKTINNSWLTNDHDFIYISLNDGLYYKNFLEKLK